MPGQWNMTLNLVELKIILLYCITCSYVSSLKYLGMSTFILKTVYMCMNCVHTQSCSKRTLFRIHSN